jgi:tight adherence protein B
MDTSPVLLTFVLVLAIFGGAYWLGLGRPEARSQARLHRRLSPIREEAVEATEIIERPPGPQSRPVEALVARSGGGLVRYLALLLVRADMRTGPGMLLGLCVAAGLAGAAVLARVSPVPLVAIPFGLCAGLLPLAWVRYQGGRRTAKFEEQFPEAIDLMARALRAGHALTTGLALVAEELPEPVGTEFRLVYDRQSFGMPLPDALRILAERMPLLDARFFVTAVLTQRESGGNLAEIFDNLGTVIRQRFRVKRQIQVVTAHARLTGWVLSMMPVAIALGMVIVAPDHIMTLVRDPLGAQMGMAAIGLWFAGFLVIRRLIEVEY